MPQKLQKAQNGEGKTAPIHTGFQGLKDQCEPEAPEKQRRDWAVEMDQQATPGLTDREDGGFVDVEAVRFQRQANRQEAADREADRAAAGQKLEIFVHCSSDNTPEGRAERAAVRIEKWRQKGWLNEKC